MQLIIQNSLLEKKKKKRAYAHNFGFSVFSSSSAHLSDCVSVAGVAVKGPQSQLRRCEWECQSGSWVMGVMGSWVISHTFSKPGFLHGL